MDLECYSQAPLYANLNQQCLEISTSMSSPLFTPLLCSERQMRGFSIFSLLCCLTVRLKNPVRNPLCPFLCTPFASRQREHSSFKVNLLHRPSLINQVFTFYCFLSNPSSINAQEKLTQGVKNISSPIIFGQNANRQPIAHLFEIEPFPLPHIL